MKKPTRTPLISRCLRSDELARISSGSGASASTGPSGTSFEGQINPIILTLTVDVSIPYVEPPIHGDASAEADLP